MPNCSVLFELGQVIASNRGKELVQVTLPDEVLIVAVLFLVEEVVCGVRHKRLITHIC
jgi:hypothetical protein